MAVSEFYKEKQEEDLKIKLQAEVERLTLEVATRRKEFVDLIGEEEALNWL